MFENLRLNRRLRGRNRLFRLVKNCSVQVVYAFVRSMPLCMPRQRLGVMSGVTSADVGVPAEDLGEQLQPSPRDTYESGVGVLSLSSVGLLVILSRLTYGRAANRTQFLLASINLQMPFVVAALV